jgi:tRNA-2-methylthio-N6-dimethylallyladenosine synthase
MEGCNRFCAFCVVPYTRGPERSRPGDHVLAEIQRLALEGYPEVMLLGQTVNSWRDPAGGIPSFAELLKHVAAVPGIRRVRFTSPHPSDFHPEIVEVMETTPEVCNQVHLPVQSGSTEILRRMKRDYTRDEYLHRIDFIRSSACEIGLSTDVIVGFPGESQEHFEETLSLLERVQYDQIFSFKYSARPGTEAFALGDPIPEEEKSRRLAVLQEFQRKIQILRNGALVGREFEIFVEGKSQKGLNELMGRTTQNKIVNFTGSPDLLGKFVKVRVTHSFPNSLAGDLI